jgi:hypothetical protein
MPQLVVKPTISKHRLKTTCHKVKSCPSARLQVVFTHRDDQDDVYGGGRSEGSAVVENVAVMVSRLLSWYLTRESINSIGLSIIICTRPVELLARVKKLCIQP